MRIVALTAAAAEIVYALGLGDELTGVSEGCDYPPDALTRPRVTRPGPPIAAAAATGSPVLDVAAFAAAAPDLVLVGGPADAAGIGPRAVAEAVRLAGLGPALMVLDATSVEGVLTSIQSVGAMTEAEDAALDLVEELRERLRAVEEVVIGRRDGGFPPVRVAALDALHPPRAPGRWVPEQVRLAGGWELLGHEGGPPAPTTWSAIADVDPEVIVLMPADLDLPGAVAHWAALPRPDGWEALRAVRQGRTFAVDGAGHFARPGPRIVDGIEVLAELIDPVAFDGMAPPDSWRRVS